MCHPLIVFIAILYYNTSTLRDMPSFVSSAPGRSAEPSSLPMASIHIVVVAGWQIILANTCVLCSPRWCESELLTCFSLATAFLAQNTSGTLRC
jgi:hypothetical protein